MDLIGYRMAYFKANFRKEFEEKEIKFIELTNSREIIHYAGFEVSPKEMLQQAAPVKM